MKAKHSRSNVECLQITIVGALPPATDAVNEQLRAFMTAVEAALMAHFPDFVPGYPPVTFTVVTLPELREKAGRLD